MLSLREVSIVGSSRFEQFGAFTYRLKISRQVGFSGRCFPDNYSLALEIQRIASINFRVSARLGRLAQSVFLPQVFGLELPKFEVCFSNL
ncbi:hypothetical protein [Vibrio metschnikovii]|uniref:hypothetical protein n=1 Tax=Vibrio metschnikovii TaxID=28172 RepID=UPI0027DEF3E6|nr:hypothetical protein [Vibrio metschnikovii]